MFGLACYVRGTLLLVKFYLVNIWTLHELPQWMRNPESLAQLVEEEAKGPTRTSFSLRLPRAVARYFLLPPPFLAGGTMGSLIV